MSADRTRLELRPGIWLDARRALWLEEPRLLAVADLHLGYAWAQRNDGQLLPVSAPDSTLTRLDALVESYAPREVAVLGDIVHRAVRIEQVREAVRGLCGMFSAETKLHLIAGNHDRALAPLLRECGLAAELVKQVAAGPHRLLHGDTALVEELPDGECVIIGHEHPAITVGDRVTSVKCPCFLVAEQLIVLPAFSAWAAGGDARGGQFLSPLARAADFTQAVAIMAGKLMPMRL